MSKPLSKRPVGGQPQRYLDYLIYMISSHLFFYFSNQRQPDYPRQDRSNFVSLIIVK